MSFPIRRHLRVGSRPRRPLCGQSYAMRDAMIERVWVTCPDCQSIIRAAHPGADPAKLFNHPRVVQPTPAPVV